MSYYYDSYLDDDETIEDREEEREFVIEDMKCNNVLIRIEHGTWHYEDDSISWASSESLGYGKLDDYLPFLPDYDVLDEDILSDEVLQNLEQIIPPDAKPGLYSVDMSIRIPVFVTWTSYKAPGDLTFSIDEDSVSTELGMIELDGSYEMLEEGQSFPTYVGEVESYRTKDPNRVFKRSIHKCLGPSRERGFYLHEEFYESEDDESFKTLAFYDETDVDWYIASYEPSIGLWEIHPTSNRRNVVRKVRTDDVETVRKILVRYNEGYVQTGPEIE